MEAMTTAAIIHSPELPTAGLTQDMHDPTIQLSPDTILHAPGLSSDDISVQIQLAHLSAAIERLHPAAICTIFKNKTAGKPPQMPILERIKPVKTEYWQFGSIKENEGTIAGTYKVHDKIFLEQLDLSTPGKVLNDISPPPPSSPPTSPRSRQKRKHIRVISVEHNAKKNLQPAASSKRSKVISKHPDTSLGRSYIPQGSELGVIPPPEDTAALVNVHTKAFELTVPSGRPRIIATARRSLI
jgi:hypothetical protein